MPPLFGRQPTGAQETAHPPQAGYAPPDRLAWDSWLLKDDIGTTSIYRLFHLDAPQKYHHDKDGMDNHAVIRGAISTDLEHWQDLGVLLKPGRRGSWDDLSVWSGNAYRENGKYYLFYTGRNRRDGWPPEKTQRIGLATSTDGLRWRKTGKPLLEPDGRWYETPGSEYGETSPVCRAWRDPVVVKENGKYYMFFTAKTRDGDPRYRGCIGLAVANRMEGPWEVRPPVLAPGRYAEMEVPQLIHRNNRWYLFFSTLKEGYSPTWAEQFSPTTGLHCYVADRLTGPYRALNGSGIVETPDNLYTIKLVDKPDHPGDYLAYGWYRADHGNEKAFTLSPMMPVTWENTAAGERILVKSPA